MGCTLLCQDKCQSIFRASLTNRTRHRHDGSLRACTAGHAKRLHRAQHIIDDVKRASIFQLTCMSFIDNGCSGALLKCHAHIVMPIIRVAFEREEEIACIECARINRHAGDGQGRAAADTRVKRCHQTKT